MTFQKGHNINKGRKHSEEFSQKLSENKKGNKYWLGKHHTEEAKLKISKAHKGKPLTEEHKRKLSEAGKGRKHSEETKLKISRRGEKSCHWKGGKVKDNGYIIIYKPDSLNANKKGYVYEHRLMMEEYLGRYLYPYEIIHHINGIRTDNRIENLELLPKLEHNTQVQKVYQENLKLKEKIKEYELLHGII